MCVRYGYIGTFYYMLLFAHLIRPRMLHFNFCSCCLFCCVSCVCVCVWYPVFVHWFHLHFLHSRIHSFFSFPSPFDSFIMFVQYFFLLSRTTNFSKKIQKKTAKIWSPWNRSIHEHASCLSNKCVVEINHSIPRIFDLLCLNLSNNCFYLYFR